MFAFQFDIDHLPRILAFHPFEDGAQRQHLAGLHRLPGTVMVAAAATTISAMPAPLPNASSSAHKAPAAMRQRRLAGRFSVGFCFSMPNL
ncbi:MAG: hypothetical protein IPO00_08030 [Betaproteobacteria bacterium]|nr:hypothetical protein [Betaproteobacteria bacterium]